MRGKFLPHFAAFKLFICCVLHCVLVIYLIVQVTGGFKMKFGILSFGLALFMSAVPSQGADRISQQQKFGGAQPEPIGLVSESPTQLRIGFTSEMMQAEAFTVACSPAIEGYASWADNNRIWTYNFKAKNQWEMPRLAGGAKCEVRQTLDLQSTNGDTIKAGTISYEVSVAGPNVTGVYPADGFHGRLRESEPVVLIQFDGPVDKAKFFAEQNAYLSYRSANAPGRRSPSWRSLRIKN